MACQQARELMAQGLWQQASAALETDVHRGKLNPADLGEAYSLLCMVHTRQGDYYAAARCGELALGLAEAHGLKHLGAVARFRLGTGLMFLGDLPIATDHLEAFLAAPGPGPEAAALVPKACFNLGIIRVKRREYAAAICWYQRAAGLFEAAGQLAGTARSRREIAWCLLQLDRAHEAEPYLRQVEGYAAHHDDDEIRNRLLVDWALYYHKQGQVAASMACCQEIFQPGRRGVGPEHRCEAEWVAGLNALDLGHLHEAEMFASAAVQHAVQARWPFMINQANLLRRRVMQARACIGV